MRGLVRNARILLLTGGLLAYGFGAPTPAFAYNDWNGSYRKWPWRAGAAETLSTLPGQCPHCPAKQSSSAWKAIDVATMDYETVYSIAPGTVDAAVASGGAAGLYLRVKDADGTYVTYEHLKEFLVRSGSVVAGQPIAVSGCTGRCSGPHLHFQRHDGPSFSSKALDLTPISSRGGSGDPLRSTGYRSDNAGIGYSSAGKISKTMQAAYKSAGGYASVGVTADIGDDWSPCREDGVKGTWWRYGCSPRSGIAGSVQTFYGKGNRPRALMHPSGAGASYVLYKGILGAYTDFYGGHDWVYWLGYPTGNRYKISSSAYRQNFQHGHILFYPESCRELIYLGSSYKDEGYYCDY